MLDFGRDICNALASAGAREWLVTNGLGGYAMGTVAGILSRSYHGLLIAAMAPPDRTGLPPAARTLLLAKLDETATYHGQTYRLFANSYLTEAEDGTESVLVCPDGFVHLERFHLEGTTPVWTYALADAILQKRVWMQQGANTTYVHYSLTRASGPLSLDLEALATYRDHHDNVAHPPEGRMDIEPVAQGVRITAFAGRPPFYLLSREAEAMPQNVWRRGYFLAVEHYRGLRDRDSYLAAAQLRGVVEPGRSLTVVASTEASPNLNGERAYAERRAYEWELKGQAPPIGQNAPETERKALEHLILAADQFVVRREVAPRPTSSVIEGKTGPRPKQNQQGPEEDGRSVIAGYPWFGDWGRDTMISLPGLTLATGRPELARRIVLTFAAFVDQGMLPNRFPDAGEEPEYNTIDATLWYVEAIRAYHAATGDRELVAALYPVLQDIVRWHRQGTRHNIYVDPEDGLVYGSEEGVQLTWMDAKAGDWVVTPRMGKPVEISALWYNAMRSMADFARILGDGEDGATYAALAEQTRASFGRFWYDEGGYCYDVLDGPDGDDSSLRPNQLLAVSLPHSPLSPERQRRVVDVCARALLTSHGLRSLATDHPNYVGHYGGDRITRDAAYHQGTVWGWLIGPFVTAYLRAYGDPQIARTFLAPLLYHLNGHGVGSMSEIFDGDAPFTPRGCIAQAWTVAEVLRAWRLIEAVERST